MLTLGISGGFDLIHQNRTHLIPDGSCHDSAAVLVEDGEVIAAIEEERLNRIKHTNKAPVTAIRFCLNQRGASLSDLDALAYYGSEENCNKVLRAIFYNSVDAKPVTTIRQLLHEFLRKGTGADIDDRKLVFVNHHLAHAASACMQSGFSRSLVFTLDGTGDFLSGTIGTWEQSAYRLLRSFPNSHSLGILYDIVIAILGYGVTEEYKVMGLAPYGDPARFRAALREIYELLPHGDYRINWNSMERLYALAPARKRGEPLLQEHIDIAAALQESLEEIVFHVLRYYRTGTGLASLCMAGGVAHNSTLNGKLLYSGMFERIFVQPASHDAGCAIGAALYAQMVHSITAPAVQIGHVYWGTGTGGDDGLLAQLELWSDLIDFEYTPAVAARAAELIAGGSVIGWVQGRSEFGPRALGNRSIIADPRPAENKDIVNRLIKKREAYRPFAPSVLEHHTEDYFEVPVAGTKFPFMSFTLKVKPEQRHLLGATTHVDGTARVQTVSREANPVFWELIEAFRQITGLPVVLNTSFNNNVEPIVDSIEDAIVCFLTTGLHYLVVGNYLVKKKCQDSQDIARLSVSLPAYSRLVQTKSLDPSGEFVVMHAIANSYSQNSEPISQNVFDLLLASGPPASAEALAENSRSGHNDAVTRELLQLWEKRAIILRPR